jgi:hypothetical protein
MAAIIAVGSLHTPASFYREREKQQRWREAVKRLKLRGSNASS